MRLAPLLALLASAAMAQESVGALGAARSDQIGVYRVAPVACPVKVGDVVLVQHHGQALGKATVVEADAGGCWISLQGVFTPFPGDQIVFGYSPGATAPAAGCGPAVLAAAQALIGQKVGDGQCSGFTSKVLRDAGATLGGEVPLDQAAPGDVLHFQAAAWQSGGRSWHTAPDHWAVVVRYDGSGVEVLHQNWNEHQYVERTYLPLRGMTGKLFVLRPR